MKYIVIRRFTDKLTKNVFNPGDPFPTENMSEERLIELTGYENNHKNPIIVALPEREVVLKEELNEDVEEKVEQVNEVVTYPKQGGGGYFELSDGTKVQGKEAAEKAEAELDKKTE